ncbi:MAG: NEW3 domain-containing protein, partial [Candidatus Limnocylindrales bacterium]
ITPSDQAIAGDYVVSFSAAASEATTSQDIRVTVETSLTWAIVGIALIVLVFVGLGWVFQRFGRR